MDRYKKVTITLHPHTLSKLDRMALKAGYSGRSSMISFLIEDYAKKHPGLVDINTMMTGGG